PLVDVRLRRAGLPADQPRGSVRAWHAPAARGAAEPFPGRPRRAGAGVAAPAAPAAQRATANRAADRGLGSLAVAADAPAVVCLPGGPALARTADDLARRARHRATLHRVGTALAADRRPCHAREARGHPRVDRPGLLLRH